MNVPHGMREAIETMAREYSSSDLHEAVQRLTERYRHAEPTSAARQATLIEVAAYLVTRMPATFSALSAVFERLQEHMPEWRPHTLLDVGAGPGTVGWVASMVYPNLDHITAWERERAMREIGQQLAQSGPLAVRSMQWRDVSLGTGVVPSGKYDMVVGSYVMGELPDDQVVSVTQRLWNACAGALVLVEPGTSRGFERIIRIRQIVLNAGGHLIAPCPHQKLCPLPKADWCHFSQRLQRSRMHRHMKGGDAPYEDEKFSYLIFHRRPITVVTGPRIVRHPMTKPGHIELTLCTDDGIRREIARKSQGAVFREARKARWGDLWNVHQQQPLGPQPGSTPRQTD